ncbi:uncharacterized protein AMSG_01364 [Thecamonas trahens ATCC 50062]|uniref:Conserved oligomeric Golgi complex subunit 2 n=1 Tax=Thecamonas trahens ATCC 50062 TaxID=461836 RepID=A0A0L0DN23_THETB|nr:hypothetical protein AMSG_01364 [Thecamonas trahens ATCC 50062]KNC53655.1 hypothetical protein AMSG_01364 [Thecamonas trahens ATCC 50062]|eukprot:XP_013761970.1 hypothetical protein AMSG_01364 [Thecamonas trahens ATCC 50062]
MTDFVVSAETFETKGEFVPETYVAAARKVIPLGSLKKELDAVREDVSGELFHIINEDYAAFLALSTDLSGLDDALDRIAAPLATARAQVASLHAALDAARATVAAKAAERAAVAAARAQLALCIDAARCVDKLEALLGLRASGAGLNRPAVAAASDSHVIERVGAELNRLLHYVEQGEGLAFIRGLTPRISAVQDALRASLRETFLAALNAADGPGLKLSLRTYAAVNGVADAEAVVARHVVTPALEAVITKAALEAGSLGSHNGLPAIYDAVVVLLRRPQLRLLLELAATVSVPAAASSADQLPDGADAPRAAFEFMGNAVFAVLLRLVDDRIPHIFAPGLPDLFHTNYSATSAFLVAVESVLGPVDAIQAFRASDHYLAFMRRWNLPVYFQLRFQGLVGPFAAAFDAPLALAELDDAPADALPAAVTQTRSLVTVLADVWAPTIVLRPLVGSFFKLSLQMLARYTSWVDLLFDRRTLGEADETPVSLFELAALDADANAVLCNALPRLEAAAVGALGPETSPAAADAAAAAVSAGLTAPAAALAALRPKASAAIVDLLTSSLTQNLDAELSAIPRAYRGLSKPTPTTASVFLATLFDPLDEFEASVVGLAADARLAEWRLMTVAAAATAFAASLLAVLTSVKNAADSLRRLRGARPAGSAGPSDTFKIYRQLSLDLAAFDAAASSRITSAPAVALADVSAATAALADTLAPVLARLAELEAAEQ